MSDLLRIKKIMDLDGLSLAVAESITTGNIQSQIGSVSGASTFFKGGITVYNLGQKVKHLGIEELYAKKVDCVSEQVAIEMAKGVCRLFNSRIGIATTGYAESDPEQSIYEPYGFYAIWDSDGSGSGKLADADKVSLSTNDRVYMQMHVTKVALRALVKYLNSKFRNKKA